MKKILFMFSVITCFAFLSSCTVDLSGPRPYGVWKSEDPELLLDIMPNNRERNKGQYVKNGETIDVIVGMAVVGNEFGVYDLSAQEEDGLNGDNPYFWGTYKIQDEKLYYTLKPRWVEETGYKTIIFEKIESYEIPEDKKADSFWAGFIKPPFTDVIIPAILILPVYLCPLFIKRKPRP